MCDLKTVYRNPEPRVLLNSHLLPLLKHKNML